MAAYWLGLPSVWAKYIFYAVLILVPVVFFIPVIIRFFRRMGNSDSEDEPAVLRLSLFKRCLCVLLSYMMLLTPGFLESLAEWVISYDEIDTRHWSEGDTTIDYTYDDNGSVTTKITTVTSTQAEIEQVVYEYNLQNRLYKVKVSTDGGSTWDSITEYKYNTDGIRVQKIVDSTVVTDYFVDSYNHTGFSQVLEETTDDGQTVETVTYTIGDDVISQAKETTEYLLYDGHGSTRQLIEPDLTIVDTFGYDAYGIMLGGNPQTSAGTNLLYSGEYFDTSNQSYYLRARWYDSLNGRFNRMDDFSGNNSDPQSLHKYLYCHNNPVNAIDPSGRWTLIQKVAVLSIACTVLSVVVPAVTGVIMAVSAGVSPWEYFSELFSSATWKEALIALGVGAVVSAFIKPIIKTFGKRAFAFVGLAFSLWSLFRAIKLSVNMAKNAHITRAEIAHYMAVLTASIILAIVLGKIARHIAKIRGKGYKKPYLRKKLREEVIANADKTADGRFIDPNTKQVIEGKYHFGHTFGREYRRIIREAIEQGMTQKEFNNWMNSHSDWFQIEDPFSNMSHKFEKPGV